MRTDAAPYPHEGLQGVAALAAAPQPHSRTMLCASPARVSVAHFSQRDAPAVVAEWADALLEPTLSALRAVAGVELSTSSILYAPSAPAAWVTSAEHSAAQARAIGWDLVVQLPVLEPAAASVLLLDLPPSWAAAAPLQGRAPMAVHLADDTLVLVGSNGTATSPEAARQALEWLFRGFPALLADTADAELPALAREVMAACMQGAAQDAGRFLRTVEAQPGAALPASTAAVAERVVAAHAAAAAAAAAVAGPWQKALALGRAAWAAAAELASHPDHAAHPSFPSEHTLAVLLPIALPPLLLLSQAAAKEIKDARRRKAA